MKIGGKVGPKDPWFGTIQTSVNKLYYFKGGLGC